ncbi:MAG: hypothetical protein ACI4QR_04755 [Eubacteriales bacterium]
MKKEKVAKSNGIPFSEENAIGNYAEFTVARKPDKEIKLKRFLFMTLYLVFAAVWIIMFTVVTQMVPVVAIILIIEYILYLLTWHLTKIEYTYMVEKGNFHIYRICGRLKAKEVLSVKVSENMGIYPLNDDDYKSKLDDCEATLDFSEGKNGEDRYFAIFMVNGKKTAVYFSAATKLLTTLKYYGGENVIVTYVSH